MAKRAASVSGRWLQCQRSRRLVRYAHAGSGGEARAQPFDQCLAALRYALASRVRSEYPEAVMIGVTDQHELLVRSRRVLDDPFRLADACPRIARVVDDHQRIRYLAHAFGGSRARRKLAPGRKKRFGREERRIARPVVEQVGTRVVLEGADVAVVRI